MGRAPPHMIFKRAVKHMMKSIIPSSLKEVAEAEDKMHDCFNLHGVGSKKCSAQVRAFNELQDMNKSYKNFVGNKNYKIHAMKHLAPAERKYDTKGRYHYEYFNFPIRRFRLRGIDLDSD